MRLKDNKGITLISLGVTMIILLAITGGIIYSSKNQVYVKNVNQLYQDIDQISAKIDEYYLENEKLPTICEYTTDDNILSGTYLQEKIISNCTTASLGSDLNDENDNYYVIDLEKLEGLTLYYGYDDDYESIKTNRKINDEEEIYVINEKTHQIYFPKGVSDGKFVYFTY